MVDAGRFPLGVETATLGNAARLVPLVNSGTAHARYYLLHAAVAAASPAPAGAAAALDQARWRVRRAEVVLAAASLRHAQDAGHRIGAYAGEPHGYLRIGPELKSGSINVPALAQSYSKQTGGFLAVYRGAEIEAGLLARASGTLLPGAIAAKGPGMAAVLKLVDASTQDELSSRDLDSLLPDGCLCRVHEGAERQLLARLLFGSPVGGDNHAPAPAAVVRARRRTAATARLLLTAIDGKAAAESPDRAMAQLCYDDLAAVPKDLQEWALYWRGALLRNASVTAWRWLWWWLTSWLEEQPHTREQLADLLADALRRGAGSDGNVVQLLQASQPPTTAADLIVDVEDQLLYPNGEESEEPWNYLQVLAIGARRADELTGRARESFLELGELGPRWVRDWLAVSSHLTVTDFGRDLAGRLLRHAQEVSRRRIRWEAGRLRIPTRLRETGDLLDLAGSEGSQAPGLRLSRLRQILEELGYLAVEDDTIAVDRRMLGELA